MKINLDDKLQKYAANLTSSGEVEDWTLNILNLRSVKVAEAKSTYLWTRKRNRQMIKAMGTGNAKFTELSKLFRLKRAKVVSYIFPEKTFACYLLDLARPYSFL